MKNLYITICCLLAVSASYAQENHIVNQKIDKHHTAVYYVLNNKPQIKQGLYQVRLNKKIAVASGMYTNDKKTGLWHFFNSKGVLIQNFDYDRNELTYEAPDTESEGFKYAFDDTLKKTDIVTKPIKIGGRYFGYLSYLNLFEMPKEYNNIDNNYLFVAIELLISPGGKLADYNIHLNSPGYNINRVLNVNLNLLSDEDKIFIPATINNQFVSSRIIISCRLDHNNNIVF